MRSILLLASTIDDIFFRCQFIHVLYHISIIILDEDKVKATGREMQGQGDDKHTIDSDDEVSVPSITDQPLDPLIAQLLSESF